jgi:hypothetical protein
MRSECFGVLADPTTELSRQVHNFTHDLLDLVLDARQRKSTRLSEYHANEMIAQDPPSEP